MREKRQRTIWKAQQRPRERGKEREWTEKDTQGMHWTLKHPCIVAYADSYMHTFVVLFVYKFQIGSKQKPQKYGKNDWLTTEKKEQNDNM